MKKIKVQQLNKALLDFITKMSGHIYALIAPKFDKILICKDLCPPFTHFSFSHSLAFMVFISPKLRQLNTLMADVTIALVAFAIENEYTKIQTYFCI